MPGGGAKRWCVTLFEPAYCDIGFEAIALNAYHGKIICAMVCQEEKAPDTGRLHLQLFVAFASRVTMRFVKAFFGTDTAHCEVAKGDDASQVAYCSKDDSYSGGLRFQVGDFSSVRQGRRTDLDEAVALFEGGASLRTVARAHPSVAMKYPGGFKLMAECCRDEVPEERNMVVIVLWGDAGCGKSAWCRRYCRSTLKRFYSKTPQRAEETMWFDGYEGESVLLLDDFECSQIKYRTFLRLLDVYAERLQVKGSTTVSAWDTVVITSNVNPIYWYPSEFDRQPLMRRLDIIVECRSVGGWVTDYFNCQEVIGPRRGPSVNLLNEIKVDN